MVGKFVSHSISNNKVILMKILIIDRDQLVSQMLSSRLEGEDVHVVGEAVKGDAVERLGSEDFDVVFVDPSPMKDAQALVMNIRRASRCYPYIVIMGDNLDLLAASGMGGNNFLNKPVDTAALVEKIEDATKLRAFAQTLGDTSEDFPSAGGVISKSAFNQLFLSSIDRGWRYAESANILSVSIENYKEIKELDGDYHASYSISKLAHHLVRLRRQSDVIGQTGVNQYSLILQRIANEQEAEDAAKRFAVSLDDLDDFIPSDGHSVKIRLTLMELPTGKCTFDQTILKRADR